MSYNLRTTYRKLLSDPHTARGTLLDAARQARRYGMSGDSRKLYKAVHTTTPRKMGASGVVKGTRSVIKDSLKIPKVKRPVGIKPAKRMKLSSYLKRKG